MPQVHTLKLPKLRAPKGATLFPLNADEDQRERMPRLGYVDLVLYHERGVGSAESLLKKHAHSLGYLEHLPAHYAPVAVHGADFNETVVRNKFRFVAVKGTNDFFTIPFRLFARIAAMKTAIVVLNGFNFPCQALCLKACLPARTRILVRNHGEQPFPGLKSWFQRWAALYVDAFLFVSREQAAPWRSRRIITAHHKVFEVMEGSTSFTAKDPALCREWLQLPDGPVFLWVGRLDSNKDPLTILRAFHRFKQSGRRFTLCMVFNAGALAAEVSRFIGENDLGRQARLVGAVEHEDLEVWYNAADYFVLGSHHEGSGFALCEALACGCIPIVTNIPSFKTMTSNGRLGFLFEPGNVGQLVQTLNRTVGLNVEPLREEARQFFQEELSHQAIARKVHLACQEVLGQDFPHLERPLSLTPRL